MRDIRSFLLNPGEALRAFLKGESPEENEAALYEHLLRRNERLVGAHFSIGIEDAVFLRGELPVGALTEAELDRVIGTLYATVEQCFRALLRIGFASRFG